MAENKTWKIEYRYNNLMLRLELTDQSISTDIWLCLLPHLAVIIYDIPILLCWAE